MRFLAAVALALAAWLALPQSEDARRTIGQLSHAVRHANRTAERICAARHVVIIGAGPAGLAVSARLQALGVPFVTLEKGSAAGASWRGRYDRLHLHTHRSISALPHWPFPDTFPAYVSARDLADYYAGYAATLGERVQLNTDVTSVERDGEDWLVTAVDGRRWRAAAVVMATGQEGTPLVPPFAGLSSFAGALMHSSVYSNGSAFAGKRVLVVGFGNSGAELALDLWEHGANVSVVVRSPVHILPRWLANLPLLGARPFALARGTPLWLSDLLAQTVLQSFLYSDLPARGIRLKESGLKSDLYLRHSAPVMDIGTVDLIRRGEIAVVPTGIQRFEQHGVVFEGQDHATPFDAVVLATGYDKGGAPHSRLLSKEVVDASLSSYGYLESGRSSVAQGLFFSGFTDHSGRLAEIYAESAKIADEIARDLIAPFDRLRRRHELDDATANRAVGALPAACALPGSFSD